MEGLTDTQMLTQINKLGYTGEEAVDLLEVGKILRASLDEEQRQELVTWIRKQSRVRTAKNFIKEQPYY